MHYTFILCYCPHGFITTPHSPGGLLSREEKDRVIAVCRWTACGSCWLWRRLCATGLMTRRICVRLWPCCSETRLLSRSHILAWLQLDSGLCSRDPHLPRPLVLKPHTHTHQATALPHSRTLECEVKACCYANDKHFL